MPKRHKARTAAAVASAAAAVVGGMAGRAPANVDNAWTGAADTNWNNPANWSLGHLPTNTANPQEDALVNTTSTATPGHYPVITQDFTVFPTDMFVGRDNGNAGRLDQTAGTAGNQNGNWMFVGVRGATGTYNLANPSTTGGTLTGMGQGTGTMNDTGRFWVGGDQVGGGTGVANINTTGTLSTNDIALGSSGGTGTLNFDAGSINSGGWNFFGKEEAATGGNGTFNMAGGTLTNQGRTYLALGNATGKLVMTGGTYNNNNTTDTNVLFAIGVNNLANATTPTVTLNGGTINAARIFSIGGADTQGDTNAGFVGPGKGSMTVSNASALLNTTGEIWVGDRATSTGDLTVSAGAVTSNNWFVLGRTGATGTLTISGTGLVQKTTTTGHFDVGTFGGSATVNLDGGTLEVPDVITERNANDTPATTSTFNFNGGTLRVGSAGVTAPATAFMAGLNTANVRNGGAVVDTNGNNATIAQPLLHSTIAGDATTDGGLKKLGAGTLTLTAANTYTGGTTVSAGTLEGQANGAFGTGNVTVTSAGILTETGTGATSNFIADTATLSIATGGVANLNYTGTDLIGSLIINGVARPAGVYGAATNPGVLTGTGTLTVVPEPTAIGLLGLAGVGLIARRRRRHPLPPPPHG